MGTVIAIFLPLAAETPVPTTVGEMLKAMRALEGPDPLEDLLE